MDSAEKQCRGHHFVLVHGACHGAWCWYKLKALLELAGHRVTILNLAGSGTDTKTIYNVHSFAEYSEPLLEVMAALEPTKKVILVGHSFGGLSLALVSDRFPEKVSVAVFLTAFLPDTVHPPSYVLDQYFAMAPKGSMLDTEFAPYGDGNGNPEKILTSMFFGPKFLSSKLSISYLPERYLPRNEFTFVFAFVNVYLQSSNHNMMGHVKDLELAKILVRPSSLFREELCHAEKYSVHGFGACKKAYVICNEDQAIPEAYQRWMIKNNKVDHVMEIPGADHMPMLSKSLELNECLQQIAYTCTQ